VGEKTLGIGIFRLQLQSASVGNRGSLLVSGELKRTAEELVGLRELGMVMDASLKYSWAWRKRPSRM